VILWSFNGDGKIIQLQLRPNKNFFDDLKNVLLLLALSNLDLLLEKSIWILT
jgi:hypothetical protein